MPRRALKVALGLSTAAAASLALASGASAAVIVITPDNGTGTDHLSAAIAQANTNSSTSNTIVLSPGSYQPKTQPITISKNLTIVGDHSFQSTNSNPGIEVNGATAGLAAQNNLFVINHGVNVRMDSFNLDAAGAPGYSAILDNGNLTTWGLEIEGPHGFGLNVSAIGAATMNESGIVSGQQDEVNDAGSLTLNNVSITQGAAAGIDIQTGYTLNMTNTLLAYQVGAECNGHAQNGGPGSLDDDGTCGVQYSSDTAVDSYFPISPNTNGGPTTSVELPAGNPDTTNKGVGCPTVDQRFFVNPTGQCDIGSITDSATQETAAPSCKVTATIAGNPKQQQVSLQDTLSGVGPQPGPATDNPSNTVATAYPPPAAVPVPGYAVDNLQINNGTVALTPFAAPATSPLVLTASKTNQAQSTQWSFTGLNWAGVANNCY